MHSTFKKALTWNSSTAFLYKAILLFHQIMLYAVISKPLYGIQSTLFAAIYALIACTNFGFEETLLPFFSTYSQSKQQFKQILHHFILRIIAVAIISMIFYITLLSAPFTFIQNIRLYCDDTVILLIPLIFCIESIKKSISTMIQLAFLQKNISYAELGMLVSYVTIIWTIFAIQTNISLYTIFIPMLITTSCELLYLSYIFIQYYQQLSLHSMPHAKIPLQTLFMQRLFNWIHQVTKTFFSPNTMTIMFAYVLGFQQAATIKFFTNIITLGYTCIHKTVGISSGVALSAINHAPIEKIKEIFQEVTQAYFKFLYTMSFVIASVVGYSYYVAAITPLMALQIIIFFCIGFLEQITLTYEQLFMSQKKSKFLASINLAEVSLLLPTFYFNEFMHGYTILLIFVIVKLLSLMCIELLASKFWNIQPIVSCNLCIKIAVSISIAIVCIFMVCI